jgi:hypothetical protein
MLAVMTTIGQSPSESRVAALLSQGGLFMAVAAMIAYGISKVRPAMLPASLTKMGAVTVMGLGIAMCSESLWVAMVILLVCLAHWLNTDFTGQAPVPGAPTTWTYEAAFGLAVLLTLFTMIELRGALPIG